MSNAASLVSDSNIPQLPDRREDFLGYEWKMKAYLDVRGLLGFIEPPAVKDTAKDGQDANGKDIASVVAKAQHSSLSLRNISPAS